VIIRGTRGCITGTSSRAARQSHRKACAWTGSALASFHTAHRRHRKNQGRGLLGIQRNQQGRGTVGRDESSLVSVALRNLSAMLRQPTHAFPAVAHRRISPTASFVPPRSYRRSSACRSGKPGCMVPAAYRWDRYRSPKLSSPAAPLCFGSLSSPTHCALVPRAQRLPSKVLAMHRAQVPVARRIVLADALDRVVALRNRHAATARLIARRDRLLRRSCWP
jgi:hypothetical protein